MKTRVIAGFCVLVAALMLYWSTLPGAVPGAWIAALAILVGCGALVLMGGEQRAPSALPEPITENLKKQEAPVVAAPAPARPAPLAPVPRTEGLAEAEVVGLLSLLQRKGRFVDFLMDDITRYDDKQVGAAARIVHQGCAEVLREYFQVEPVRADAEGMSVTLDRNYNPNQNRLVGKVVGQPPFRGVVLHRGWKTTKVDLPRVVEGTDALAAREIIAPAEIEVT